MQSPLFLISDVHPDVSTLFELLVELHFEALTVVAKDEQEAKTLLVQHPSLKFAICDEDKVELINASSSIKYAVLAQKKKANELKSQNFLGMIDLFALEKDFKAAFEAEPNYKPEQENGPAYVPVALTMLYKIETIGFPVYIRLSSQNFIKILNAGDTFNSADATKYSEKKIDSLYIEKRDLGLLSKLLVQKLNLVSEGVVTLGEQFEYSELATRTIRTFYKNLGVSEELEQTIGSIVNFVVRQITKTGDVKNLFETKFKSSENYLSAHSAALSHVACVISRIMGYKTIDDLHSMAFSAFLHDITLNDDQLAQIAKFSDIALVSSSYVQKDIDELLNHANHSAALTDKIDLAPSQCKNILKQHHERPDGTGFPERIADEKIDELSAIFIFAHDFVSYAWDKQGDFQIRDFFAFAETEYPKKSYFYKIAQSVAKELLTH